MSFVVRHRRRAREELNACAEDLGLNFIHSVEGWLQELADEADPLSFQDRRSLRICSRKLVANRGHPR